MFRLNKLKEKSIKVKQNLKNHLNFFKVQFKPTKPQNNLKNLQSPNELEKFQSPDDLRKKKIQSPENFSKFK